MFDREEEALHADTLNTQPTIQIHIQCRGSIRIKKPTRRQRRARKGNRYWHSPEKVRIAPIVTAVNNVICAKLVTEGIPSIYWNFLFCFYSFSFPPVLVCVCYYDFPFEYWMNVREKVAIEYHSIRWMMMMMMIPNNYRPGGSCSLSYISTAMIRKEWQRLSPHVHIGKNQCVERTGRRRVPSCWFM